jgi:hypothetical protein
MGRKQNKLRDFQNEGMPNVWNAAQTVEKKDALGEMSLELDLRNWPSSWLFMGLATLGILFSNFCNASGAVHNSVPNTPCWKILVKQTKL